MVYHIETFAQIQQVEEGYLALPGRLRRGFDRKWISVRFQSSDEAEIRAESRTGGGFRLGNCRVVGGRPALQFWRLQELLKLAGSWMG